MEKIAYDFQAGNSSVGGFDVFLLKVFELDVVGKFVKVGKFKCYN